MAKDDIPLYRIFERVAFGSRVALIFLWGGGGDAAKFHSHTLLDYDACAPGASTQERVIGCMGQEEVRNLIQRLSNARRGFAVCVRICRLTTRHSTSDYCRQDSDRIQSWIPGST